MDAGLCWQYRHHLLERFLDTVGFVCHFCYLQREVQSVWPALLWCSQTVTPYMCQQHWHGDIFGSVCPVQAAKCVACCRGSLIFLRRLCACRSAMAASRAADTSAKYFDGVLASDGSLLAQPKPAPRVHRPVVRESDMRKFATQARLLVVSCNERTASLQHTCMALCDLRNQDRCVSGRCSSLLILVLRTPVIPATMSQKLSSLTLCTNLVWTS